MKNKIDGSYCGYILLPRTYTSYRWYKPLLTALLLLVFYFLFFGILVSIVSVLKPDNNTNAFLSTSLSYDNMDAYSGLGALMQIGSTAIILPALLISIRIVKERPFSSYLSSNGGWNWYTFFKSILISIIVCSVFYIIGFFAGGVPLQENILFDTSGLIVLTIMLPIQCIAEEYLFRGFLMQTFGAWFGKPIIAIILQSACFALFHPYNINGMVAIFISGTIYGTIVHKTGGLEAVCAIHILTNYIAFYSSGFGFSKVTSNVDTPSLIISVVMDVVFALAVLWIVRKKIGGKFL